MAPGFRGECQGVKQSEGPVAGRPHHGQTMLGVAELRDHRMRIAKLTRNLDRWHWLVHPGRQILDAEHQLRAHALHGQLPAPGDAAGTAECTNPGFQPLAFVVVVDVQRELASRLEDLSKQLVRYGRTRRRGLSCSGCARCRTPDLCPRHSLRRRCHDG
uniref:Putative plasmid protein n=1 Tax=Streptoalloteichus tenebrarius (strain ATCC 17920 / DSM 40477 / JCM 4838 / CBS 697.72 / NBRC 16177 / NCIMB 11028 / NRRL B-12390 / A12253. 1 / ISP 5477) TaxID=1933 RepID=Q2MFI1_STRSD|nr:putative plasmid protein [Streptoalloteichus tenebrarius]